jgi:multiple antibiotic resistance protein
MDLNFFVYSFTALFIIVNPITSVPIFVSIMERFEKQDRKDMAKKAAIIAALTLISMTFTGNIIFRYMGIEMYSFRIMGIEMYSFRIAGGILLFIISIEMLFGKRSRTKSSAMEEDEAQYREDVVVTPLAIPLLTGPGAITTGIVLFNSAGGPGGQILLLLSIVLVFLVSYIIISKSEQVFETLGYTGTRVIVRIMGLLLAAIAVQFIITGIGEAALAIRPN